MPHVTGGRQYVVMENRGDDHGFIFVATKRPFRGNAEKIQNKGRKREHLLFQVAIKALTRVPEQGNKVNQATMR